MEDDIVTLFEATAENASNLTNSTNSTTEEVPVILNDLFLLLIGIAWIVLCFFIFQGVRICTRPKDSDSDSDG